MFQKEERVPCIALRARETTDKVISNGQNKHVGGVEVGRRGLARENGRPDANKSRN